MPLCGFPACLSPRIWYPATRLPIPLRPPRRAKTNHTYVGQLQHWPRSACRAAAMAASGGTQLAPSRRASCAAGEERKAMCACISSSRLSGCGQRAATSATSWSRPRSTWIGEGGRGDL